MKYRPDLICHTIYRIGNCANSRLDTIHDTHDEVASPAECLRSKTFNVADGTFKSRMDHVINLTNDAADSRLYAIPDGRNRVLNGIHHTRDIAADAVPDTCHHTLDGI